MSDLLVQESPIHRPGVFAARASHAGKSLQVLDDSRVVDAANPRRAEFGEFERHCDYLAGGRVVLLPAPNATSTRAATPTFT